MRHFRRIACSQDEFEAGEYHRLRAILVGVLVVLCQLSSANGLQAQNPPVVNPNPDSLHSDSVGRARNGATTSSDSVEQLLFGSPRRTSRSNELTSSTEPKQLRAIVTAGIGEAWQYWADGTYDGRLLPTAGLDFYLVPGGTLSFLFGGHFGFTPRFTTGFDVGTRIPFSSTQADTKKWFIDAELLFFDNGEEPQEFVTGGRLAIGKAFGDYDFGEELRLVGEFRGNETGGSEGTSQSNVWVGLEAGVSFSLVGSPRTLSKKDSLRGALKYIASNDEMRDFDQLSSDDEVDGWLDRFWLKRESRVAGSQGDLEREFNRRMRAANEKFSSPSRLGAETEPGRIIILYGVADFEVRATSIYNSALQDPSVRALSDANQNAEYMLWLYHDRIRGNTNSTFLFRRTSASPLWLQEYSNVPGEAAGMLPDDLPLAIIQALPHF